MRGGTISMDRKLDLRTGRPVWFAYRAPSVPAKKLVRDISTEVVVVGLGISGAMIAEALTAKGLAVVAIDRRGPVLGSTPATTALVQFEIDTPLTHLSRLIGKEDAVRAWQRSRLALGNLRDRIADLGIRCAAEPRPSLLLAGSEMGSEDLREEAEAREAAGLRSRYLTASALKEAFGLSREGAIVSHGNLTLDPRRLTAGLLLAAHRRGARYYEDVEMDSVERDGDQWNVSTREGRNIRCRNLVLATGYEMLDIVPVTNHRIISTWAMATKPQPRAIWPKAALIWEASDPYLYMRSTEDGRIICGGEDEDFADEERRDAMTHAKIATIQRKLAKLFPNVDTTADYAWAGSFGTTKTGLPYIGQVPRRPGIFAVMGYGGNGITYAQLASELIATALGGKSDSSADLFALR